MNWLLFMNICAIIDEHLYCLVKLVKLFFLYNFSYDVFVNEDEYSVAYLKNRLRGRHSTNISHGVHTHMRIKK